MAGRPVEGTQGAARAAPSAKETPVFRIAAPIEYLQLAGFIYEYSPLFDVMRARQADRVAADGTIVR